VCGMSLCVMSVCMVCVCVWYVCVYGVCVCVVCLCVWCVCGFRANFLSGLCIYKFLYVWMDLHLEHGQRIRNLAWMYWLPNPLLPFIWFRVAVPRNHPALEIKEFGAWPRQSRQLIHQMAFSDRLCLGTWARIAVGTYDPTVLDGS